MESKSSIYLIRHGESKYNSAKEEAIKKGDKYSCYWRKDLIDCELTELGIQQAKEAGEKLRDLNISLVLVSPLRRALQTAFYAFENHPNKPKFKAIPLAREIVASSCNFPSNIEDLQKEFPFVDFSELEALADKRFWIIETFEGEERERLENLTKDLPEGPEKYEKFLDLLTETAGKLFPKYLESNLHMVSRVKKLRAYLQTYFKLLRESEKIAYVGHAMTTLVLTATKFDEKGYALDGKSLKNAEFLEYFFNEEINDK